MFHSSDPAEANCGMNLVSWNKKNYWQRFMSEVQKPFPYELKRFAQTLALVGLLAIVWETLSRVRNWNPAFVPPPSKVILAGFEFRGQFFQDAIFTTEWLLAGFVVTLVTSLIVAI